MRFAESVDIASTLAGPSVTACDSAVVTGWQTQAPMRPEVAMTWRREVLRRSCRFRGRCSLRSD